MMATRSTATPTTPQMRGLRQSVHLDEGDTETGQNDDGRGEHEPGLGPPPPALHAVESTPWPRGRRRGPLRGRRRRVSRVETTGSSTAGAHGRHPRSARVNSTTLGAPTAAARWLTPESLPRYSAAQASTPAALPAVGSRRRMAVGPSAATRAAAASASAGPSWTTRANRPPLGRHRAPPSRNHRPASAWRRCPLPGAARSPVARHPSPRRGAPAVRSAPRPAAHGAAPSRPRAARPPSGAGAARPGTSAAAGEATSAPGAMARRLAAKSGSREPNQHTSAPDTREERPRARPGRP